MYRRTKLLLAAGAALLLASAAALALLPGEESAEPAESTTTSSTTSTTSTTTVPSGPPAPLTGLPVSDPALLGRPALIVKIDNAEGLARPQAGLDQADLVYEEQVEGGVTRFAAVYHSQDSPMAGPIRSARTTDIAIAAHLGYPIFAYSGANEVILSKIRAAPLVDLGFDWHPEYYHRRADRRAPDDIFSSTPRLWEAATPEVHPPEPIFSYRSEESADTGKAVTSVDYSFGGAGTAVSFSWDREQRLWVRTQAGTDHLLESGDPISVENVVVMFVTYSDTGLVDKAGSAVLEANLVGSGEAWVLRDGRMVQGSWSRQAASAPAALATTSGAPIELTPGRTWIVLLPPGRATSTP